MARRRKTAADDAGAQKRVRSLRSRERRERRKKVVSSTADNQDVHDTQWIAYSMMKMHATRILNAHPERPYWLSIPKEPGVEPVAGYVPCNMVRHAGRIYYGFLFQEHRDLVFDKWPEARKELTNGNGPLL